jgi:hypothetical protein
MIGHIQDLSIIFSSILLEAFPFILFGVFISSVVEEFVTPDFFTKMIPKNPILGSIVGVIMGFFVPACDCAVIPIAKRLIKKGVPVSVAVTFMLASPIINPVVLLSTFYAFGTLVPKMIFMRSVIGILIAIFVGFIIGRSKKMIDVLKDTEEEHHHEHCHHCGCSHTHNENIKENRLRNIINHAKDEFWDISKFLIIGAFIASAMQVFIPRDILLSISSNNILSIISLMIFAYLLSLCSTSDSFIAKTFVNQFSNNAILAFLLLGPMIDIKNTVVLLGNYKKDFVIKLILAIFIVVFISSIIITI